LNAGECFRNNFERVLLLGHRDRLPDSCVGVASAAYVIVLTNSHQKLNLSVGITHSEYIIIYL
jgi:hypothetical protein